MSKKYLVKAYTYDGAFYGYACPHEDGPDYSFYDTDKTDAIRFDSYSDADAYIEKFADGSELEYIIIQDVNENATLDEFIRGWVEENYGANEADNPSWDIKALANSINEFLSNK